MSDDGSITVAQALRKAAQWPAVSNKTIDLRKIIGVNAEITSPTMGGAVDAALNLARLVDPVTHATPDGSCERCGAGPRPLSATCARGCGGCAAPAAATTDRGRRTGPARAARGTRRTGRGGDERGTMRGDIARRVIAWDDAHRRLQRVMRGRATPEEAAWLRAEAEALSPLVDEARRELAVAVERDEDAERDAWRIARGGD